MLGGPGDGARGRSWLAVLLPVVAAGAALFFSWERWINPFVDSGREMDVPWRLLQGERLYRDVTYYYGPLGPWVHAAALWVFGHRWVALQAVCLALAAAVLALLYRLTREAGSRQAAIAATTLAAAFCLGAPHGGAFVFPYSSSCLLALAGALLTLWLASRPAAPRPLLLVAAGAGLTVALASRMEVGIAAVAAIMLAGGRSRPPRETLRWTLGVVPAALLAAGAQYAWALRGMPWQAICHDGPLTHLSGMPPEWHTLYLNISGLDRPWRSASMVALSLLLDAALLGLLGWFALPAAAGAPAPPSGAPALLAGAPTPPPGRRRYLFAVAATAVVAAYLASPFADPHKNLPPLTPALPLVATVAAAVVRLRRWPPDGPERARFLLFGFSAALALRVVFDLSLGPRMGPYTAPPLPGVLATAAVLVCDGLAPRLPQPAIFRRRAVALLAVVAALFFHRLDTLDRAPQTLLVETPAGSLRLPEREALAVAHTLSYLAERAQGGDTLTAFPESGFFNFVTGLRSPLRQDQIFPGVLYGQRELEAARQIERAGPRFILLCNRPTPEYGPAGFGTDYDVWLWHDIERHYALTAAFGWGQPNTPVGTGSFFIRVYERVPRPDQQRLLLASAPRPQPDLGAHPGRSLAKRPEPRPPAGATTRAAGQSSPAALAVMVAQ